MFKTYQDPFFDISAWIRAPRLKDVARARGVSLFGVVLHALNAGVNQVPALRLRLREGGEVVVEHEAVHPAWAVLAEDGTVRFARGVWSPERAPFLAAVEAGAAEARAQERLSGAHARDDVFYASCMPWMDVRAVRPERSGRPEESVPRLFWGRVEPEGFTISMTVHHGLVDGLHLGLLVQAAEAHLAGFLGEEQP